jgi:UDP-glucose 4-epimerase
MEGKDLSSVLVTGGTGFIGSWVTRKLIEDGQKVIIYTDREDRVLLKDISDKYVCVIGDILDLPHLIDAIKKFDVERVIHMATMLIKPLEANPFSAYRTNVDGTLNVFEAARLMGIKRVVAISSSAVYDKAKGEYAHPIYTPIDEDYPKAPITVYGATKLFMENMASNYKRIYGLDIIVLRFAATYGPGKQGRHAFSLSSTIIESALLGQELSVSQNVDQLDDMIYTKDVAEGIVLACYAKNPEHQFFHLATGKGETFRNLIRIVNETCGKELITIEHSSDDLMPGFHGNFNRERSLIELGFRAQYNLDAGVADYIATMRRLNITPVIVK